MRGSKPKRTLANSLLSFTPSASLSAMVEEVPETNSRQSLRPSESASDSVVLLGAPMVRPLASVEVIGWIFHSLPLRSLKWNFASTLV